MAKALFTLSFAGAMLAGIVYAANSALSMPDVKFSYATGECVEVVNYTDEQFDCSNYPSKFNHVWVQ
jgi:hypothetical protein